MMRRQGREGTAAERLITAWAKKPEAFDEMVDDLLARGRDRVLQEALAEVPPSIHRDFADAVARASETADFDDGGVTMLCRLFALPVLANRADGTAPDAESIAVGLDKHRLSAQGGLVCVSAGFFVPEELLALPLSRRRMLANAVLEGRTDEVLAPWDGSPDPDGNDERMVAVIGVCGQVESAEEASGFLEGTVEAADVRAFQRHALQSGGGIVDVCIPGLVGEFEENASDPANWASAGAGAHEEINQFINVAASEAGLEGVCCLVDDLPGGKVLASAVSASGRVLDTREFDPAGLPMPRSEILRALGRAADAVYVRAPTVADGAVVAPPPPRRALRVVSRPRLSVVQGGWFHGLA